MQADVALILVPFGFTGLESEIYTFLLQESPATGYRVAQAIGKPSANTYKAIESLQQKGAVLVDESKNRLCRAVPPGELLARLTRDFEWRRAEAELRLSNLDTNSVDDRVYGLRARNQVIERARHMIAAARSVVLLSCSAHVVNQLRDLLAFLPTRDVRLFVACDEPLGIDGANSIVNSRPESFDDIRLISDAAEYLFAFLKPGRDEVQQAVWSRSPYLSVSAYRGLAAEFVLFGLLPPSVQDTPGYTALTGLR
ncbi:MAG TPA: helix-turn-helix domain-containing protein [Fimbriimonadaceae bacterium]|nr:helix-turn-helix domain-containing protein [Fimbriimonadaceae bacterium]